MSSKLPWYGDKEYLMTWYRSVAAAIAVAPPFIAGQLETVLFSLTEILNLVTELEACAKLVKKMIDVGYVEPNFDFDRSWGQVEKICKSEKTMFDYTDRLFQQVVGRGLTDALEVIRNLPVAHTVGGAKN